MSPILNRSLFSLGFLFSIFFLLPFVSSAASTCGDVTNDGIINANDAQAILGSLLVPPTVTLVRPDLCDVGGSVGCTTADATIITRSLLNPPTATIVNQCTSVTTSPIITSITPTSAKPSDTVSVFGKNFFDGKGNPAIEFHDSTGLVGLMFFIDMEYISSDEIRFKQPSRLASPTVIDNSRGLVNLPASTYKVRVLTTSAVSNFVDFHVNSSTVPSPSCGDVNGDGVVTITDAEDIVNSVLVPPTVTLARPDLCDVGGSLQCTTADAIIIMRSLLVPPQATITQQCVGVNAPMITSVTPVNGDSNTLVTIYGKNLSAKGTPMIEFLEDGKNGKSVGSLQSPSVSYISTDGTMLQFKMLGAFTYNVLPGPYIIRYSNNGGAITSNSVSFAINAPPISAPAPTITSIAPDSVSTGGTVNLFGTNFSQGTYVSIDGSWTIPRNVTTIISSTALSFPAQSLGVGPHTIQVGEIASSFPLSNALTLQVVAPSSISTITSFTATPVFIGGTPGLEIAWKTSAPVEGALDIECISRDVSYREPATGRIFPCDDPNWVKNGLQFYSGRSNGQMYLVPSKTGTSSVGFRFTILTNGSYQNAPNQLITTTIQAPQVIIPTWLTQYASTLFTRDLRRGMLGPDVKEIQTLLAKDPAIYPEGRITSFYGLLTENAVKKFQCTYAVVCEGTPSTTGYGVVGKLTKAKLQEVFGGSVLGASTQEPNLVKSSIDNQIENILKQIESLRAQLKSVQ